MIKEKLMILPTKPGCYLMKDSEDNIIYIGKAKNLRTRVKSYFMKIHTGKTGALVNNIASFDYIVTNNEIESLILEINLIKKYSPKYNIMLKDDKTYPYIELTSDNYPSLKIIRSKTRKKVKGKLFGPYPNSFSAKKTVELINRVYPLRKCNKMPKTVCLYYHIDECLGYCQNDIDQKKIEEMKKEIIAFLDGDYKIITKRLEEEMQKASDALNFEKAINIKTMIEDIKLTLKKQIIVSNAKYNFDVFGYFENGDFLTIETLFIRNGIISGKHHQIFRNYIDVSDVYIRYIVDFYDKFPLPKQIVVRETDAILLSEFLNVPVTIPKKGDIKKILDLANLNASITSKEKIETIKRNDDLRLNALNALKDLLGLDKLNRIELFDNSHLFGTYYVGAMVCFDDFLANKKEYRKFKISTDIKDDLNAMKEVIYRRYYRVLVDNLVMPDLIIVDGGELQVNACKKVIDELGLDIKIIGLKKDDKHRTNIIVDENLEEIAIPRDNNLLIYLTKMQDEVHRYAISYHRDIKSKGSLSSVLSKAPGVGEKRRKELLKNFGSIAKIKEASIEELTKVIPVQVATQLKEYLNSIS